MSRIIKTKFDNTKCRTCGVMIPYGADVRWTKGVQGVVCMSCSDGATAPATKAPAPTDANAAATIQHLNERLAAARETFRQQRAEIEALKITLEQVTRERDEARDRVAAWERTMGVSEQTGEHGTVEGCDDASLVDPDSINVLAPGGVEAWLHADAAKRAAGSEPCACIQAEDDFPL